MAHRIVGKAIRQSINNVSNYMTLDVSNEAAASLNYLHDHAKRIRASDRSLSNCCLRQGEENATIESVARMIDGCQIKTQHFESSYLKKRISITIG